MKILILGCLFIAQIVFSQVDDDQDDTWQGSPPSSSNQTHNPYPGWLNHILNTDCIEILRDLNIPECPTDDNQSLGSTESDVSQDDEPDVNESNSFEAQDTEPLALLFQAPIPSDSMIALTELEALQLLYRELYRELCRLSLNTAVFYTYPNTNHHDLNAIVYFIDYFVLGIIKKYQNQVQGMNHAMIAETLAWVILSFKWLITGSSCNIDAIIKYIWRSNNGSQIHIFGRVVAELQSLTSQELLWVLHFYIKNLKLVDNFCELRASSMLERGIPTDFAPINLNVHNGLLFNLRPIQSSIPPSIRLASQYLEIFLIAMQRVNDAVFNNPIFQAFRMPVLNPNYNFDSEELCRDLGVDFSNWQNQQLAREVAPSLIPFFKKIKHLTLHLELTLWLCQLLQLMNGHVIKNLDDVQRVINEIIQMFHQTLRNWHIFNFLSMERTPEDQVLIQQFEAKLVLLTSFLKNLCTAFDIQDTDLIVSLQSLQMAQGQNMGYIQHIELLEKTYASLINHLWTKIMDKQPPRFVIEILN